MDKKQAILERLSKNLPAEKRKDNQVLIDKKHIKDEIKKEELNGLKDTVEETTCETYKDFNVYKYIYKHILWNVC